MKFISSLIASVLISSSMVDASHSYSLWIDNEDISYVQQQDNLQRASKNDKP